MSCGHWEDGVMGAPCPNETKGPYGKGGSRDIGDITVTNPAGDTIKVEVENGYMEENIKVAYLRAEGHGASAPPTLGDVKGESVGHPNSHRTWLYSKVTFLGGNWSVEAWVILDPQPDKVVLTFDLPTARSASVDDVDDVWALDCCRTKDSLPPTGACSADDGCYDPLSEVECGYLEGTWSEGDTCAEPPAVSEWGMVVLVLLLLTAVTIVVGRRRRAAIG